MKSDPLVSVVIPAYNSAAVLGDAIDSVMTQSYSPIEIIVVDDGSSDATAKVVWNYSEVRYLRQSNRGPSAARNHGIAEARGEYIAFLDADDVWLPRKLAEQMSVLEYHSGAGLVFADMQFFSAAAAAQVSMFETHGFTAEFFGQDNRVIDAPSKLVRTNFIPTSTVLAPKSALVKAGGFDEQFTKSEDWDLWLRIALRWPIVYSPKVLMMKRVHEINTSLDAEGMNVAALEVLEKLNRENHTLLSNLGVDMIAVLREAYRNLGYFYLRRVATAKARAAFWRSLSLGFEGRAFVYFLSTFLGNRIVASVVRARG